MKSIKRFSWFGSVSLFLIYMLTMGTFDKVQATYSNLLGLNKNVYPMSSQPQDSRGTDTVLVFDTSGSMQDYDSAGISKLQAAQQAGMQILNIIEAENEAITRNSQVGLVSYGEEAYVGSELTSDIQLLKNIILNMDAYGLTAMPDGLRAGMDQFSSVISKKTLILLSDGLPNVGLDSDFYIDEETIKQQVIDLSTKAGKEGICVFTVGLGNPSYGIDSIDEAFLTTVANASGCGKFYYATDAIELANVYVELRHTSTGEVLFRKDGEIAQGEELDLGTVNIPEYQDVFLFTVNWPGSKLQPVLIDPLGKTVDSTYAGVSISEASSLISYILNDPLPGDWTFKLIGLDVPENLVRFNAILSTRAGVIPTITEPPTPEVVPLPPSGSGGIAVFLIVLAIFGTGLGIFVYTKTLKNKDGKGVVYRSTGARIRGEKGEYRDQIITMQDGLSIGRGSLCNIILKDSSISRKHCIFRFSNNAWYIQDLGSSSGTRVNGRRIEGKKLNSGDKIEIGSNVFIFLSE